MDSQTCVDQASLVVDEHHTVVLLVSVLCDDAGVVQWPRRLSHLRSGCRNSLHEINQSCNGRERQEIRILNFLMNCISASFNAHSLKLNCHSDVQHDANRFRSMRVGSREVELWSFPGEA